MQMLSTPVHRSSPSRRYQQYGRIKASFLQPGSKIAPIACTECNELGVVCHIARRKGTTGKRTDSCIECLGNHTSIKNCDSKLVLLREAEKYAIASYDAIVALVNEHRRISNLKRSAFGIVVLPEEDKFLLELCGTAEKSLRVLEYGFPGQYNRLATDSDKKLRGERSEAETSILKAGMLDQTVQKQDVFGLLPPPITMRMLGGLGGSGAQGYGYPGFGAGQFGQGHGWQQAPGSGYGHMGRPMIEGAPRVPVSTGPAHSAYLGHPRGDWDVDNPNGSPPPRISPASAPRASPQSAKRTDLDRLGSPTPAVRRYEGFDQPAQASQNAGAIRLGSGDLAMN